MLNSKMLIAVALTLACGAAAAEKEKDNSKSVQDAASSVVNELGKGLEAVGKAVGPAVNKAEKAVRGGAKGESDKRGTERQ
ncbi:MAG: hypothetical protein ACLGHO_05805 [Gammaproteobacteria bacterium]